MDSDLTAPGIQGKRPGLKRPGEDILPASSEDGFGPCNHLPGAEGFQDIIIGPEVKAEKNICFFNPGRQHDDGDHGCFSDFPADVYSIHARKHDVEKNQIKVLPVHEGKDMVPPVKDKRIEPIVFKIVGQNRGYFDFIFNNQYIGWVHDLPFPAEGNPIVMFKPWPSVFEAKIVPYGRRQWFYRWTDRALNLHDAGFWTDPPGRAG